MKTLKDYIKEAKRLWACTKGIDYAKRFSTIEEFVNSSDKEFINWFFGNCNIEEEVYYMLKDKNFAIRWASQNGHTEAVKLLLNDYRVDPSIENNFAIRWASQNGHTEVVKLLLQDERVDPSDGDNYAIKWASDNGHAEVVKVLLQDERVDPSDDNNYAIRWTSYNGHTEVIKLLLQDDRVRNLLTKEEIKQYS